MGIKTDLNIAPYFDDYDIAKKYYRVLFKPGFAVQARELTQLQTNLQNQIEQFGENVYKEGSIIKGCTFTEINSLKYIKVVDGIRPEDFIERTEIVDEDTVDEYYYEIEDEFGLKALIIQGASGFQSRAPDLNTFFVVYLNTVEISGLEKKKYEPNDTLEIHEYILRTQEVNEETTETIIDNGVVATTSVANFSNPIGNSFGLNSSEGVIFQRGHFLFVDDQTIVVKKYLSDDSLEFESEPNNISVGYIVDETIVNSQQDSSLLDNANGSPNENAPGADRLLLVPNLIARPTEEAEADSEFFILRRYENGEAVETRDISQFNSIAREMSRRTYETHGDYTLNPFEFNILKREENGDFFVEMSEGTAYSKGYRISNDTKRYFRVPEIESTETLTGQPINFNYGGFVKVIDIAGNVPLRSFQNVDLIDENLNVIGSTIIKNFTEDRIYIFGSRMNTGSSFSDVRYIGNGSDRIEISPRIINSSESSLIFNFNRPFTRELENIDFSIRKSIDISTDGNGVFEIVPDEDEAFDQNSIEDILVIQRDGSREKIDLINAEILINGNLQIQVDTSVGIDVTSYYNAKQIDVTPRTKQVLTVYLQTTYDSQISKYTLGLPDVFDLLEVRDSGGTDYTSSFRLVPNQKDDFYDHSYIEKIPGSPNPPEDTLTIRVRVFRINVSNGINFFTVDSYPNINLNEIPNFETQNGNSFDLKSCLDFRPYRLPIAAYATSEGSATQLTAGEVELPNSSTELFSSGINYLVPSFNTSGSAQIEYYASRVDHIIANSYGRFKYVTGNEVSSSAGKLNTKENAVIAEIRVPGYPLLTNEAAFRLNRKSESISISPKTVNTYTMKDIDKISKKLDRLVYYTTLSALETSTKNLLIQDEFGNNRFKNGIIVDPFSDLSIADVTDASFNSSVDPSDSTLRPSIKHFPLDLKLKNTTDSDSIGDVTTLSTNRVVKFLKQQYATNFRSCTSNVYSFVGTGFLTPEYDVAYDTVSTPSQIDLDLSQNFIDFTEALSEFVPLTSEQSVLTREWDETSTNTTGTNFFNTTTTTTNTTREFEDIFRELSVTSSTQEIFVGDFVTNTKFKPFMRSREIAIEMYGLRPNTRHYFFFDEISVDSFVARGTYSEDAVGNLETKVIRSGNYGSVIRTNDNGELFAVFKIPENTFLVGERELVITDVDSFENINSAAASIGRIKYNAYNFSVEKTGLTASVRTPEIATLENRTNRSVTTRTVTASVDPTGFNTGRGGGKGPSRGGPGRGGQCPIAQTFYIKDTMTQGSDALYVSGIDLYFKRKSTTKGVSIQIREVENGYPAWEILTFGKKHLRASEVNVSDDGSVATSVTFDGPVRLDAEKEYCFVVQPDSDDPNYLIFTTKAGGIDLSNGNLVNADWGDGVLFTSTNNRAWTAYQDEDIKFDLYRYNFNVNEGTVELETADYEFLEIDTASGKFINGELAYSFKGSSNIPVVLDNSTNVVTGSGLNSYDQGDYFYVETPSEEKDIFKVVQVVSNSELIVDKIPSFSGSLQSNPVIAGIVSYFNPRKSNLLILSNSSAKETAVFEDTDNIRGLESDVIAPITSVIDFELSYVQAMINRIVDDNTDVKASLIAIDPLNPNDPPYSKDFEFSSNKAFNDRGCVIFSKSNDIDREKNLKLVLKLEKEDIPTTTPLVDLDSAQLFAYVYQITNDPETTSKYISKKVELQEGFDAEDFRLYLTGYRPIGSDIKAYIRVKNEADPVSIRDNGWIELEKTSGNLFSSNSNTSDFKEFIFEVSEENKAGNIIEYSNETGTYSGYRSFALRIDLLSENVASVPKVLDYRGIAFE